MKKIIFEVEGDESVRVEIDVSPLELRFLYRLKAEYDKESLKDEYRYPSSIYIEEVAV